MTHRSVRRTLTLIASSAALLLTAGIVAGCVAGDVSEGDADEAQFTAEEVSSAADGLAGPTCQASVAGRYCGNDMISNGSASTLYSCPGGIGAAASVVSVCSAGCVVAPAGTNDYCVATADSCKTTTNCGNCVFYAKCRKPSLPSGLNTYANKQAIVNTYTPTKGAVAIIDTGNTTGHVAYVESVVGTTITLAEGNWPWGTCNSSRSGTMSSLNIYGFFN